MSILRTAALLPPPILNAVWAELFHSRKSNGIISGLFTILSQLQWLPSETPWEIQWKAFSFNLLQDLDVIRLLLDHALQSRLIGKIKTRPDTTNVSEHNLAVDLTFALCRPKRQKALKDVFDLIQPTYAWNEVT
jgi:hypothetical protein